MPRLRPLIRRPDPVNPGRNGATKFYRDENGHVRYGERPAPRTANVSHFSTARERQRETGVRHHVIEYSEGSEGIKKYVHSAHNQTAGHQDKIRSRGGTVHAVYTAHGRKLSQGQVASNTNKREKELEKLTEEAQRRANRGSGNYMVVSVSPRGTNDNHLSILSEADADKEMETARSNGATVHTVKTVKPHDENQPTPAKTKRAPKPAAAQAEHVDGEDVQDTHTATKSEETPEVITEEVEEIVKSEEAAEIPTGRQEEDFWLRPVEGDEFATVPEPGFSYRQIGTISKSHGGNGLFTVAFSEEQGPLRRVDILTGDTLRTWLDQGKIVAHKLVQPEEIEKSDLPLCRHCNQQSYMSQPQTGYCDKCLAPVSRWW